MGIATAQDNDNDGGDALSANNVVKNTTTNINQGLTLLDRTVPIVLTNVDNTPSRNHGISIPVERMHRFHGTSLVAEASVLLSLGASTYATACTIFHRFFQQVSLNEYDVWSVAMASTLLATKVEEESISLKTIIHVFCHLYRKRLLLVSLPTDAAATKPKTNKQEPSTSNEHSNGNWNWNHPSLCFVKEARSTTLEWREKFLDELPLPMKLGPVYKEWHEKACNMEATILRQLGFTLHWIPDSHPHKFILYFFQALELTDPKLAQRAWNYCNDSCRLDLCVRFPAEVVAVSSILLATRDFQINLPMSPVAWWEPFIGKDKGKDIVLSAANAILGLCNLDETADSEAFSDFFVASRGYIKSLVAREGGSFTDPDSFLWMQMEDSISSPGLTRMERMRFRRSEVPQENSVVTPAASLQESPQT